MPHIGDEAPYIQIVRLTAESGDWLPLKTTSGLENTKPPLLFWLGMVSTDWPQHWSLFRLRFPIVVFTFLTAAIIFLLTRQNRVYADSCGLKTAFLGNGGRKAATIFSLRYSSSR